MSGVGSGAGGEEDPDEAARKDFTPMTAEKRLFVEEWVAKLPEPGKEGEEQVGTHQACHQRASLHVYLPPYTLSHRIGHQVDMHSLALRGARMPLGASMHRCHTHRHLHLRCTCFGICLWPSGRCLGQPRRPVYIAEACALSFSPPLS